MIMVCLRIDSEGVFLVLRWRIMLLFLVLMLLRCCYVFLMLREGLFLSSWKVKVIFFGVRFLLLFYCMLLWIVILIVCVFGCFYLEVS